MRKTSPLLIVGLILGGSAAFAHDKGGSNSNPFVTDDGEIRACVSRIGTIRLLPKNGRCIFDEREIAWNLEGPAGPAGPIGATGAAGPTGPMGPIGLTGATGAAGAQGPIGLTGATGATGPMGPMGPAGLAGIDGAMGPMGPMGLIGPMGPAGATGAMGPMGLIGPVGPAGATGPMGPAGPPGPPGEAIDPGPNLSPFVTTLVPFDPSVVAFARIDGIDGESKVKGFEKQIEISGFLQTITSSVSVANGGAGGGAGKVTFGPLTLQGAFGKAEPTLWQDAASGKHIARIELRICDDTSAGPKCGFVMKLTDVLVTSFDAATFAPSNARPTQTVMLDFSKIDLQIFDRNPDGSLATTSASATWDVKENTKSLAAVAAPAAAADGETATEWAFAIPATDTIPAPLQFTPPLLTNTGHISGSSGNVAGKASFSDGGVSARYGSDTVARFRAITAGTQLTKGTTSITDAYGVTSYEYGNLYITQIALTGAFEKFLFTPTTSKTSRRPNDSNGEPGSPVIGSWDISKNAKN